MREMRDAYRILVRNIKGRSHPEYLSTDVGIMDLREVLFLGVNRIMWLRTGTSGGLLCTRL
jgi:hypothetical protein